MPSIKPLLMITGFLGAGKTTLLRNLLVQLHQREILADVILNDFTNADIDVATLDGATLASVAPLAAGCACCDSLEELVLLCKAAASGKGDLLLIELNGTADPLALLETFTLLEKRLPLFPRWQVCVIDARRWEEEDALTLLKRRQLETSGFWYLSHGDQLQPEALERIRGSIARFSEHAVASSVDELIGLLQHEINGRQDPSWTPKPIQSTSSSKTAKSMQTHRDPVHALSHRFTGCQFALPESVGLQPMKALIKALPSWVLRAKALVRLHDKPGCRWLFEKVGKESLISPIPSQELLKTPASLMCIGAQLNPDELQQLVTSHLRG